MNNHLMKGIIDMHVHSNPDLRHRAYDDFELMEAGIRVGARAIVIKTHQGTTMDRAYLCNRHNEIVHKGTNEFTMFGSITLNQVVGGLNVRAVETALKLGAKVVWLPTQSARNHMEKMGQDTAQCVEVIQNGKPVKALSDIFSLVRGYGAVLGTGHLSPEEILVVTDAARNAGVEKIVITHPEWWIVGMDIEMQKRLVEDYDVILERCYAQNMGKGKYKSNLEDNLAVVKEIGFKNVMVSTDGGQVENPHWEVALEEYISSLLSGGIPEEQVYYMTHTIQRKLLGLEEKAV